MTDEAAGVGFAARAEQLAALRERLRNGTAHVAEESDRWFLAALRGMDQGLRWSREGATVVSGRMADGWERLRSALPRRSTRQRLHDALLREARRARLDPSSEELQSFVEGMATLLDLVLAGTIDLEDVGFSFEVPPEDEREAVE